MKTKHLISLVLIFVPIWTYSQLMLADFISKGTFSQKKLGEIVVSKTNNYYYMLENECIVRYNFETGKIVDTVLNSNNVKFSKLGSIDGYSLSSDEKQILFNTNLQPLYRYSFYAKYFVYSVENKRINSIADSAIIRDAVFSPDGKSVSYMKDNNLFIQELSTGSIKQITSDGLKNNIINGCPDWVYEEEFTLLKAYQWSPTGRYIAYLKFDESKVKEYPLIVYGTGNYPEIESYKYPKAGEANSIVQVWVYDTKTGSSVKLDVGEVTDQYIPRFCWTLATEKLAIVRLNRKQNKLDILLANVSNGATNIIYSETNSKYIDEIPDKYPIFVNTGDNFLITSEKSGSRQVYFCNTKDYTIKQISQAKLEVVEIVDIDVTQKNVFYKANETSATQTTVFSVNYDGLGIQNLTPKPGTHAVTFNFDKSLFIDEFSSIRNPLTVSIKSVKNNKEVEVINNESVKKMVDSASIPLKEMFRFRTTENVDLNGWMIKPIDFDSTKKYPLLLFVYGGPGVQTVLDKWDIKWFNYLATQGYIVVSVDNRGTGGRGEAFKKITYKNLGYYEVLDQIETAKYFAKKTFIDANRIGIYGWSYGGYMSTMCILKGASVFKTAIAVAPPSSWRFYDSVYTERYMDTPQNNAKGYFESSTTEYADSLRGKFLLIHGTADDNVHFQNSMALDEALVQANKPFEMQVYPDKNHSISGGNTSLHLYTRMTEFLDRNLKK